MNKTGATLFPAIDNLGFQIDATIGIETDAKTDEIINFFEKQTQLIEPATNVGENYSGTLVYAKDLNSNKKRNEMARRRF